MCVGALRVVNGVVAAALVHRVVIDQSHLVARQSLAAVGGAHLSARHGAIPEAGLHHTALVELALRAVGLVGTSEDELARAVVRLGQFGLSYRLATVVEGQYAVGLTDAQGHLGEATLHNGIRRDKRLVIDNRLQFAVAGQPELQSFAVRAVREQRHVAARLVGTNHQVYRQILAAEVALGLTLHAALARELQRHGLRHVVLVHLALHLEVGDGVQVVVLYVLGEVEDDVVADA